MENLNEYLQALVTTGAAALHLEPNKEPYVVSADGSTNIGILPLQGTQISMMVFPLIPPDVKQELPSKSEIEFSHPHTLCRFDFIVRKSPAGFMVTVRPDRPANGLTVEPPTGAIPLPVSSAAVRTLSVTTEPIRSSNLSPAYQTETISIGGNTSPIVPPTADPVQFHIETGEQSEAVQTIETIPASPASDAYDFNLSGFIPSAEEYVPEPEPCSLIANDQELTAAPLEERRVADRREVNSLARDRMDALFRKMCEAGASNLHLSVSVEPMIRDEGRMRSLECDESVLSVNDVRELLTSIMPSKNRDEFDCRNDTDFAYEIPGLARFRCNAFTDRKGPGGVFRRLPTDMRTADQLGLSEAIKELCSLSKGLVVVTGPTGSGKSTTLCAMVDLINKSREHHIITIEDPIEFTHENQKCLINQREVYNHTDSFKRALRAALREDPDIVLLGEMRDLETISIALETAETGQLVFGAMHTSTAASTVDRIIDQFPADRQQQVRIMLSESLRGVIAQTLLPKKGGGRVAAREVLIVTPDISNLIREGKTTQILSAMQRSESHGMVTLNDALFGLVEDGIVAPTDAHLKAVDKTTFEAMLTSAGYLP